MIPQKFAVSVVCPKSNVNGSLIARKESYFCFFTAPLYLLSILILLSVCLLPIAHADGVCSIAEFQCSSSNECIPLSQQCDGLSDCPNNEDELNCPNKECTADEFDCGGGKQCILRGFVCDNVKDCENNRDEENCVIACPAHQFKCQDSSMCIDKVQVCDERCSCSDCSDEGHFACAFYVEHCNKNEFNCSNGHCVDASLTCNGIDNCGDNSDELLLSCETCNSENGDENCDTKKSTRCSARQFECHNQLECIPAQWVCDKKDHCSDKSDELDCPEIESPAQPQQQQVALNVTDWGEKWSVENSSSSLLQICPEGYHLEPEHNTCEDIDECIDDNSLCSGQKCVNTAGSFKCHCNAGYFFTDNRFCLLNSSKPNLLLYGKSNQMQLFQWTQEHGQKPAVYSQTELPLFQASNSSLIFDVNVRANYYIALNQMGQWYINRLLKDRPVDCPMKVPNVFVNLHNSASIKRIALDWIRHLVYYINLIDNRIEALKIGKMSTSYLLVDSNIDLPQDIAVNPIDAWFVWTDFGSVKNAPRIERCNQDGRGRKTLFQDSNHLSSPSSLTIDFATGRIFWVDTRLHSISSINFNGADRRMVFQSDYFLWTPLDLDILDDRLYWADANKSAVFTINKFGLLEEHDSTVQTLFHQQVSSITIVDDSKQLQIGAFNESKCSLCPYFCDPEKEYQCLCALGHVFINGQCHNETKFNQEQDDSNSWWLFTPKMLKFESKKWYIVAAVVIAVLFIAFVSPYIVRFFCSLSSPRQRYRWIKLNNLKHSRSTAVRKSVELGGTFLATVAVNRRDDVSSGYSSISERLSVQQEATEIVDDCNSDSIGDSEEQVYAEA